MSVRAWILTAMVALIVIVLLGLLAVGLVNFLATRD